MLQSKYYDVTQDDLIGVGNLVLDYTKAVKEACDSYILFRGSKDKESRKKNALNTYKALCDCYRIRVDSKFLLFNSICGIFDSFIDRVKNEYSGGGYFIYLKHSIIKNEVVDYLLKDKWYYHYTDSFKVECEHDGYDGCGIESGDELYDLAKDYREATIGYDEETCENINTIEDAIEYLRANGFKITELSGVNK